MQQKPYSILAEIYSYLMKKIDYRDWSDYLIAIFRNFAVNDDYLLELGGGVGTIASYLREYFPEIVVTDFSAGMLLKCTDPRLYKVCCDMRMLPFNNKFDIIYSTFDTVNYLLEEEELIKMFKDVARVSNNDTVFVFDASLEKNSKRYVKYLNRNGKFKNVNYIQKSRYDEDERIHYNNFEITLPDGRIIYEEHKQKIYKFETYFDLIDQAGLYVTDCFDAFSFNKADAKCLRAQFITKKKR